MVFRLVELCIQFAAVLSSEPVAVGGFKVNELEFRVSGKTVVCSCYTHIALLTFLLDEIV